MMGPVDALRRTARRNAWEEEPLNSLDYFTVKFRRPEPGGQPSRLMVRVTHKIVDAQLEVDGRRTQLTLPSLAHLEEFLASPTSRPVNFPGRASRAPDGHLHPDAVVGAIRSYAEANRDQRLNDDAEEIVRFAREWKGCTDA